MMQNAAADRHIPRPGVFRLRTTVRMFLVFWSCVVVVVFWQPLFDTVQGVKGELGARPERARLAGGARSVYNRKSPHAKQRESTISGERPTRD